MRKHKGTEGYMPQARVSMSFPQRKEEGISVLTLVSREIIKTD